MQSQILELMSVKSQLALIGFIVLVVDTAILIRSSLALVSF